MHASEHAASRCLSWAAAAAFGGLRALLPEFAC